VILGKGGKKLCTDSSAGLGSSLKVSGDKVSISKSGDGVESLEDISVHYTGVFCTLEVTDGGAG